jgi:hypothetical protein
MLRCVLCHRIPSHVRLFKRAGTCYHWLMKHSRQLCYPECSLKYRQTRSIPFLAEDAVQVVNQAYSFLLAGYETTASALTTALFLVATHPEAQRRVWDEVDALGHTPTVGDVEGGKVCVW